MNNTLLIAIPKSLLEATIYELEEARGFTESEGLAETLQALSKLYAEQVGD